VSSRTHA
jgi:hypothetical protein